MQFRWGATGGDLRYVIWQFGTFRSPSKRAGEALTLTRGAQDLGSHPPGECTPLIVLERPVRRQRPVLVIEDRLEDPLSAASKTGEEFLTCVVRDAVQGRVSAEAPLGTHGARCRREEPIRVDNPPHAQFVRPACLVLCEVPQVHLRHCVTSAALCSRVLPGSAAFFAVDALPTCRASSLELVLPHQETGALGAGAGPFAFCPVSKDLVRGCVGDVRRPDELRCWTGECLSWCGLTDTDALAVSAEVVTATPSGTVVSTLYRCCRTKN